MTSVAVLETITLVTPLAIVFRDRATREIVSDGIAATLQPGGVAGRVNRAGAITFRDIPGLASVERGAGDGEFWAAVITKPFELEVRDLFGRYLPYRLRTAAPQRGLAKFNGEPWLPLFSAPSRRPVEGMAVLRADLYDPNARRAAAWAVVEATVDGQPPAIGIAGRDGHLMLPLPWPAPSIAQTGDEPPGPITGQSWPVQIKVRYARPANEDEVPPHVPDLAVVLAQPAVRVRKDENSLLTEGTLAFGRELVLATKNEPKSRLLIAPPGA